MNLREIFENFCIIDWILIGILVGCGYAIEYAGLMSDTYAQVNSFISEEAKSRIFSYQIICIFTFGIGPFMLIIKWLITKIDFSIFRLLSSYFFALSFTYFMTSVLKKFVGRARPDTAILCSGNSIMDCSSILRGHDLVDQFSSFPSRTAAESMAAAIFITLVLIDQWKSPSMLAAVFKLAPVFWAMYIGCIDITTRACHPDDVIFGAALGGIISAFCHGAYARAMRSREVDAAAYSRLREQRANKPVYI